MIGNLKLAIDRKDWGLVVEFYRQLTGTLEAPIAPVAPVVLNESRQKVSEVRRTGSFDDFTMRPSQNTLTQKAEKTKGLPKPKSRKKKQAVKARDIQFIDTGEVPEEPGFDKINDNVAPTPRKRKPFQPTIMECVVCHKKKEVAPLFKRDAEMYKCDGCLVKGATGGIE